jgi:hypothetical protein
MWRDLERLARLGEAAEPFLCVFVLLFFVGELTSFDIPRSHAPWWVFGLDIALGMWTFMFSMNAPTRVFSREGCWRPGSGVACRRRSPSFF